MRVHKKDRHIVMSEKDNGYQITLIHKASNELINLKVTYTDKGFGVQGFSELPDDEERSSLIVIHDDKGWQTDYAAIWKFTKKQIRRISKVMKRSKSYMAKSHILGGRH